MPARILDGKQIAADLRRAVAARVTGLSFRPGLAVVLVGDDPASQVYVRNKDRAAQEAGLHARTIRLPGDTSEADLLTQIRALNDDPEIDGILVQMPLPSQIGAQALMDAIHPDKDVDGLTVTSAGRLADGRPGLVPCTPRGVMKLLEAAGQETRGRRALVLGRSALVGRPIATLLTRADATVTVAHSRTLDLPAECRRADIVIAAVGRAELIRGDWLAPGATVIDVGINRATDGRLVGDAAYAECVAVAGAITPVPGGVGPMTIACLLENTMIAGLSRRKSP